MSARPLPLVAVLFASALPAAVSPAIGQDRGALAGRAETLQREYVRGAVDLAGEFERAGDPAGAIALLERVRAVAPDAPGLDDKLDELREGVLSRGETLLVLNAPTDWTPVARVGAGRPFRLAAEGSLRLSMAGELTPAGLPPGSPRGGLMAEFPLGALVGTYLDPKRAARDRNPRRRRDRNEEEQEVFLIGAGGPEERSADVDGVLLVRLNVPAGTKVVGKVKLTLSGDVLPAQGR